MKLGVVGLPNVGKSTLFNAITNAGAECANYPFCTIEPNVGMVAVPDGRLSVLAEIYKTQKVTPAVIEFVDIAGLVKGASKGEGLGNKFLSHIREVDAIVHVVRCFEGTDIIHISGKTDPLSDMEIINTELILADMETVDKRLEKSVKLLKTGGKNYADEVALLEAVKKVLDEGRPARALKLDDKQTELLKSFFLLTSKPVIYAANISEKDIGKPNPYVEKVKEAAKSEGAETVVISAKIEEELSALAPDERKIFAEELGLQCSGLELLIGACYMLLGLISYLTAGEKEVRAWTIKNGTKAPAAAGVIHSDFEKGFIRAEIVDYADLARLKSISACKEKGLVRSEGKEYNVRDGDVILFKFNV